MIVTIALYSLQIYSTYTSLHAKNVQANHQKRAKSMQKRDFLEKHQDPLSPRCAIQIRASTVPTGTLNLSSPLMYHTERRDAPAGGCISTKRRKRSLASSKRCSSKRPSAACRAVLEELLCLSQTWRIDPRTRIRG